MKFVLPSGEGEEGEIPMAPMIDMVFLLLIFFMVASHFHQLERVDINVPVADQAKVPEELDGRRTITVKEDGVIYLGTTPVPLDEVGPAIKKEIERVPALKIYLRADRGTPHKDVREVMKRCAENGAVEILFAAYEGGD